MTARVQLDRTRRRPAFLVALTTALAIAAPVVAATFVPMPIEDLTRSSIAVVVAHVRAVRGVVAADGHIRTLVDLTVEETLHGETPGTRITLREPGGSAGGVSEVIDGVPVYGGGEHVVAFLGVWPDGSLRTNHLALGRWVVDRDAIGSLRARQAFGRAVTLVPTPGRPTPASAVTLDELRASVEVGRTAPSAVPPGPRARATPPEGRAGDVTVGHHLSPFVLVSPGARFFEPDEGGTLAFLIDDRGDSILGLVASRQAVDDAMAAWTDVASATIAMNDGGLTTDLDTACVAASIAPTDPHRVVFDDPAGLIPPPTGCAGTLAIGGSCTSSSEVKTFAETMFTRSVKGTVVFADGWTGCAFWTQCNVAEVATHELGHALGLAHTPETDATMFATIHGDGRCADVRTDDVNGAAFIYPTTIPPTITTPSALPPGHTFEPYSETLTAIGGTSPYTWSPIFNGCPGLGLSASGTFSGTPSFTGSCGLDAKVTDADGDSHTKRFTLDVTETTTTTTSTTLPPGGCATPAECADDDPCTDDLCDDGSCRNPPILGIDGAQCLIAALVPASVCGSETIDPKVVGTMTKKLGKATTLLGRAESATTDAKRVKFVKKAGKSLRPIVTKATKFATKGKISTACAGAIRDAITAIQQTLGG